MKPFLLTGSLFGETPLSHKMRILILSLILIAPALPLPAQEAWSLDRCVAYALAHNLDIRKQDIEIAVKQAEYTRRCLDHLPSLNARIAQEYNWGRSVDMQELVIIRNKLTRGTGASVQASVSLFGGLARHAQRNAAKKALEAATHDADGLRENLAVDVTAAYLQLMLARQIHAYTRERFETIVQQKERTAQLVDAGSQPKSALNEMEAQMASEKAAMVEAGCRVRTATLDLTRLMNLPPDSSFVAGDSFGNDTIAARIPVMTDGQVENWLGHDPRIRSARARIEESRQLQTGVWGAFLPSLSLTAGYGTYYSSASDEPFRTQLDENRNPSLSFQLGIPIFNAGEALSRARQGRLALAQARLAAEETRIRIAEEIHSATIEAENCCQKYLSAGETLRAMQGLLEITEAKYNLGAATALDYIIARNNHFKAVSDYLQAKWQYLFQLKQLERYRP